MSSRVHIPVPGPHPAQRPSAFVAAMGVAILLCTAGCSSTGPSTAPEPTRSISSAVGELPPNVVRGLVYLESQPALAPSALLVMDSIQRWYGFSAFPDLHDRYRIALRNGNAPGLPEDWQASYLRVMYRIIHPVNMNVDAGTRWENFAASMFARGGINVLTIPALYCDQLPYPMSYASILEAGRLAGGYELTHVGMALRWIDENGCTSPMDAGFEPTVAQDMAGLVDPSDGVTDLEMESTAFLMYMERRDLVHPEIFAAIAEAQRPNGGWSEDSADASLATSWHPTSMAIWSLLGQFAPDVEMSPMIVPADPTLH